MEFYNLFPLNCLQQDSPAVIHPIFKRIFPLSIYCYGTHTNKYIPDFLSQIANASKGHDSKPQRSIPLTLINITRSNHYSLQLFVNAVNSKIATQKSVTNPESINPLQKHTFLRPISNRTQHQLDGDKWFFWQENRSFFSVLHRTGDICNNHIERWGKDGRGFSQD